MSQRVQQLGHSADIVIVPDLFQQPSLVQGRALAEVWSRWRGQALQGVMSCDWKSGQAQVYLQAHPP